jgi:hypothetical protein
LILKIQIIYSIGDLIGYEMYILSVAKLICLGGDMEFCTSIHCIDGRIQEKIVKYLKEKYNIKYVDSITEPGPCYVLSENTDHNVVDEILRKVDISINKHESKVIAISGHFDCAGNPVSKEEQEDHIKSSLRFLKSKYKDLEVIGFYINDQWEVEEELKFEMVP